MWRVFIVEDDVQTCEFFARSVQACAHLTLAGSAGSVSDARTWLQQNAATTDIVLTDLGLPDGSGLEVIRLVRRMNPACETLVISMFGDEDNVLASIEAGALGYIHKDATPDDIAQTILEMKAGASPISPMIARSVLSRFHEIRESTAPAPLEYAQSATENIATSDDPVLLSPREQEVLELIARGFSYHEISRIKEISVHTVQTHIKSLYRKLAVNSKSEAVFEATRIGLLQMHG